MPFPTGSCGAIRTKARDTIWCCSARTARRRLTSTRFSHDSSARSYVYRDKQDTKCLDSGNPSRAGAMKLGFNMVGHENTKTRSIRRRFATKSPRHRGAEPIKCLNAKLAEPAEPRALQHSAA